MLSKTSILKESVHNIYSCVLSEISPKVKTEMQSSRIPRIPLFTHKQTVRKKNQEEKKEENDPLRYVTSSVFTLSEIEVTNNECHFGPSILTGFLSGMTAVIRELE